MIREYVEQLGAWVTAAVLGSLAVACLLIGWGAETAKRTSQHKGA